MRPQRYYKVVNPVTGIIRRQYDGLVLPIVLLGVPIAAVLAYLVKVIERISKRQEESDSRGFLFSLLLLSCVIE